MRTCFLPERHLPGPPFGMHAVGYRPAVELGPWGVDEGYWDVSGHWHEPTASTREAIARSMTTGLGPEGGAGSDARDTAELDELTRQGPPSGPPMWFIRAGSTHFLHSPADLHLEDGTVLRAEEALPPDLPVGYHDLHPLDGGPVTRIVATPGRCHLPHDLRTWGLSTQLYASRSDASWGIGDLADLARLGRWAAGLGAGVLATSPLHAAGPAHPVDPSPYHPSSRRHLNPLHLRVEAVPGADGLDDLESLSAQGRALSHDRRIDRDRVWNLKRRALEAACARSCDDPRFHDFLRGRPSVLAWATYCAIADVHGNDFRLWPGELRRPDSQEVARFAAEHAAAVRFHQWLQWVLDLQLAEAASTIGLVQDLAVGFDAGGADAWELQDLLALDMRIGAPADDFNTAGQNWGLPPFVPWRLRHALYQPFVDTVRASLRHASESGPTGGLRIDHVMGLFRQFWVPLGETPGGGAYVRYPAGELLDILALESHRAGAFVVGEDLGTVEDSVRSELADRQVLSYRLLWFEDHEPVHWPRHSFGALATHDLPTVAGLWHGTDPGAAEMEVVRERLARASASMLDDHPEPPPAEIDAVIVAAHRALGEGASRVVVASLDDLLAVEDRPNHPGTLLPANWTTALPETIEVLEASPLAAAAIDALRVTR
jgi:4-alpha-glucanotransferase